MSDFPSRIPLFPLPLVLFPGQFKSLRIFEPRHRRLLHDCLNEALPFGILLSEPQQMAVIDTPPHRIGVIVQIHSVDALDDGSYGIEIAVEERFQALTFHHSQSYLEADIATYPLQQTDADPAHHLHQELSQQLSRYLQVLTEASGIQFNVYAMPSEPEDLAYLTATVLQINNQQKQSLLTQPTLPDMMRQELHFLASELNLMSWINQTISHDRRRGFGLDRWLHIN